jgi:alpha-beta hydrolase superfamily lysophospholipase
MGARRSGRLRVVVLLATLAGTVTLGVLGGAPVGQDEAAKKEAGAKEDGGKKRKKGGLRIPGGARKKQEAGDPLAQADRKNAAKGKAAAKPGAGNAPAGVQAPQEPVWPFHYTMRIGGLDRPGLHVAYYPAREPFQAPVLLLLHESGPGHSGRDFEEPIEELKGKSLVGHLQEQGYALLVVDLRGHGGNERRALAAGDWAEMVGDLQLAYSFLVDRHNRGEINVGKLGVIGVGDGANLAVAWAAAPGGGVSSEGRLSDIGALVLVSPVAAVERLTLARTLPQIAARFPILALSGDRDEGSIQAVRDNQRVIERHRLSRVAYFDTSLHGGRLLSFFPKVVATVEKFLDDPVKFRRLDWEPRYLLTPIGYDGVDLVADTGFAAVGQGVNAQAKGAAAEKKGDAAAKARAKR